MQRHNDRRMFPCWVILPSILVIGASAATWAAPGSLDPTFGGDGTVVTSFGAGRGGEVVKVLEQPDGKIVAVGWTYGSDEDWALARYNPDGSLDTTFGVGGMTTLDFYDLFRPEDVPADAALQSDGKIVVVGEGYDYGDGTQEGAALQGIAVARFNADGSLDTSFSADGKRTGFGLVIGPTVKYLRRANNVAIQSDGKILIAGMYEEDQPLPAGGYQILRRDFALARLLPDGSSDPAFDGDGLLVVQRAGCDSGSCDANQVALRSDGRILSGDRRALFLSMSDPVGRNGDGSVDSTFAFGGLGGSAGLLNLELLEEQPDGKIIVGGEGLAPGPEAGAVVARLEADGSPDFSYGTGGSLILEPISDFSHMPLFPAIEPDGKIL